jgi:hypothetical protein
MRNRKTIFTLPRPFWQRAFNFESVPSLERVDMFRNIARLIFFDDKNELSLQIGRRNGGIRATHGFTLGILKVRSFNVNTGSNWKKRSLALFELKHKPEGQI